MAWIVLDLDDTLLQTVPDPMTGAETEVPVDGSPEACMALMQEGHRLTVYTSRFAPMPDSEKQRLKEQIENDLASYNFPPMEVWTGTTKPDADIFLGRNHVTFDNDWNLALAQMHVMLNEMGLGAPMMDQQESPDVQLQGGDELSDGTDQ